MDSTEAFADELNRLKRDAADLFDGIKEKTLTDKIAQRKLRELNRESSRLGPTIVKGLYGSLAGLIASKAAENEMARGLVEPAVEAYQMDERE